MPQDHISEIIRKAKEIARRETDNEPEPNVTGKLDWPVTCEVKPGLDGAIAGSTTIGYVNGSKGWLIYRGLDVFELSEHSTFEETSYLLLFGSLPTKSQMEEFQAKLRAYRAVPQAVYDVLKTLPVDKAHPMSSLQTAVSALGMLDPKTNDTSVANETEIAIKLIAQFPTITGAIARLREGKTPLDPNPDLSLAADLCRMITGKDPSEEAARIMDVCLILHADHGSNASTFTTMVVNSSLSDMYSSIVAGIGSLKGPLHGGANEAVLADLKEIGSPENTEAWYRKSRESKRKVMGFGHRVYKAYDPRARVLQPLAELVSLPNEEDRKMYETARILEKLVIDELGKEKSIFPNVDFYSGIVYDAIGIEKEMFTPIFAVSRVSGWTARVLEYLKDNRIFRPRAVYIGPINVDYVPIDQRG
jgi:citrate synthase